MRDGEWIGDLARHGLIAPSFVPPAPLRELRDLTRYRRKLSQAGASERNRLLKLLESANIKLAGVASDAFGVSGRAMLRALIAGDASPEEMAQLARGRLRRKRDQLEQALDGHVQEHHRFLLALQLRRIEAIEADLATLDARLHEKLAPYQLSLTLLMQIPGIDWLIAATIIAEIGVEMSVFLSAAHLAAWAGVCPGNYESAGKRRHGRSRRGNIHLKTALVTAAIGAAKKRATYLSDKYRRLSARRGKKRADLAIAHKNLLAVYRMLATGTAYKDLGPAYLDTVHRRRTAANLVRRLRDMGYQVTLQATAA